MAELSDLRILRPVPPRMTGADRRVQSILKDVDVCILFNATCDVILFNYARQYGIIGRKKKENQSSLLNCASDLFTILLMQ